MMAVGYHKLNSSAARSRRSNREADPSDVVVTNAGTRIWDASFGNGVTQDGIVADSDTAPVLFESGLTVTMRGSAIRQGERDFNRRNA